MTQATTQVPAGEDREGARGGGDRGALPSQAPGPNAA